MPKFSKASSWTACPFLVVAMMLCPARPGWSDDSLAQIEIADAQVSLIQNTFIAAPIAGVVAEVFVVEGDVVKPGGRLVQLDDEQSRTELEAALAAHEAARLESENDVDSRNAQRTLEVSERELTASNNANRQFRGSISETEISKLQLAVDQARFAIEKAEHEQLIAKAVAQEKQAATQIARAHLSRHHIESTVGGTCVEVAVEPGEWVDQGKPVVRVISLDPIRVECFIDGRTYGNELVGSHVTFHPHTSDDVDTDASSEPLVGHVTFVSPELHPVTGQVRLWATIKNPGSVARAGMRGKLLIQPRE